MTPEERAENLARQIIYATGGVAIRAKEAGVLILVAITEAVTEEREACARLMCGFCSHGRPLVAPNAVTTEWQHVLKLPDTPAWNVPCKAQSIRARAVSR